MNDGMTLSVVDQSPLRQGGTAGQALEESIKLAQEAERLGYGRYWVAEHHNTGAFSGTSPEVLIEAIAARTNEIRVGSGGVMLSHYSALKVAEQYLLLNALHPGRIDLGIGRAPGSDQLTAVALADPKPMADVARFPRQVTDLMSFLHGFEEGDHPYAGVRALAGPRPEALPEVWLLGSSDYSAGLAASLGLPFAFADFFGTTRDMGPMAAERYRTEFRPSRYLAEPRLNVTVQALCAPTEEEARFVSGSRNLMRANRYLHLGLGEGLVAPEEAASYPLNDQGRELMERIADRCTDGDPAQVRDGVLRIAEEYGTKDIGIVTNCYAFEDRVRSYRLIAEAFGLGPPGDV